MVSTYSNLPHDVLLGILRAHVVKRAPGIYRSQLWTRLTDHPAQQVEPPIPGNVRENSQRSVEVRSGQNASGVCIWQRAHTEEFAGNNRFQVTRYVVCKTKFGKHGVLTARSMDFYSLSQMPNGGFMWMHFDQESNGWAFV